MTSAIQEKNQWGVFPRMGTLGLHDQQSYDYMFAMNVGISTGDNTMLSWYGDDLASGKYGAAMDWNDINSIANSFLANDYSYGGSDLLRINPSNGFVQEFRTVFAELNDAIIDNYNMAFLEGYGNLGYGMMAGDPLVEITLNLKFGLAFQDRIRILGFGEETTCNLITMDYMTLKWDSDSKKIEYTPYNSVYSSLEAGTFGFFVGGKWDWFNMEGSLGGQIGLLHGETGNPFRMNILDIGGMYGFGADFQISLSAEQVMTNYIKQQMDFYNAVGYSMSGFLH